jgi:hypothetical protein
VTLVIIAVFIVIELQLGVAVSAVLLNYRHMKTGNKPSGYHTDVSLVLRCTKLISGAD